MAVMFVLVFHFKIDTILAAVNKIMRNLFLEKVKSDIYQLFYDTI